jgi:poly-beta-hydroxyalkanoate depolymerase
MPLTCRKTGSRARARWRPQSALEVFAHASAPRGKPGFELYETEVDGEMVRVTEVVEARKPFGQLKHFKHKPARRMRPSC